MKITYRPEIDGLRAIAVGAVILYHAQINIFGHQPFQGGFIGVDIFFVISGYLITSIILKELVTTGSFSFKHFYERRIRRILPVLLFVMLVSLPFAWMFLLPDDLINISKSILYSLGFSSNFYFHYSGQQYGVESGLYNPFLHTWSLSVEEQYYILFPIVFLITFKYFRKYLIHILILGFISSLGLAEWSSRNYPSASFYYLHTRMWELSAGSILAYFEITLGYRSKNKSLSLILPTVGLFLIGHSILFFNDKMFHPSFYTLSPIIGVCLIIWFSNKGEIITKILSTKLFVGIGLISYSLYLWHYPIFAFVRITEFFGKNILLVFFLGLTIFILSISTYYLIEIPFRNKKYQFKKIMIILLCLGSFLTLFSFMMLKENGYLKRIPKILQQELKAKDVNLHQGYNNKVVLIGDSHANTLIYNLNEAVKKNNFSLYKFETNMYLENFSLFQRKNKKKIDEYEKNNMSINNFLKENSDLIVILHYRWSLSFLERWYDNEEGNKEYLNLEYDLYLEPNEIKTLSVKERQSYLSEGLVSQIKSIVSQGHKLVIVYPVPEIGFNAQKKIFKRLSLKKLNNSPNNAMPILSGSYEVFKKRNKLVFETLDSIKNENIYRIYPHKLFCDKQLENRCVSNDKNNIFYYDDDHLSIQGSKLVVDEIMKEIKKIELKSN